MSLIAYKTFNFRKETSNLICTANDIIEEYNAQGFNLTLRQLYYQFVARGLLENTEKSYKKVGPIINDARLGGLVDWLSIEDRTRSLRALSHWESPQEVVRACADQYRIDKWRDQALRVEVWIEKDALVDVIGGICNKLDVPYFSCRVMPLSQLCGGLPEDWVTEISFFI